jgi:proteic killer suppression protein
VIRSFRDRRTARCSAGERVAPFEPFRRQAERRLRALEAATSLRELGRLPGHRLEALQGDRAGQYAVRVNDRWRFCFTWPEGADGPEHVDCR